MPGFPPPPKYDPETVRDISVAVYKVRLGRDDADRMLKKDADGGAKLRRRAAAYDALTVAYLDLLAEREPIQRR